MVSINYGGSTYYADNTGKTNSPFRIGYINAASAIIIDSSKRNGLIIEMLFIRTAALYSGVTNGVLKVKDLHANYSVIYPVMIRLKQKTQHIVGFGLGVSLFAVRNYYDEQGKRLPYNNTTLPKLKDGKYWGAIGLMYYRFAQQISRQFYVELSSELYTSTKTRSSGSRYEINQGSGLILKGGLAFRLNTRKSRFPQYDNL